MWFTTHSILLMLSFPRCVIHIPEWVDGRKLYFPLFETTSPSELNKNIGAWKHRELIYQVIKLIIGIMFHHITAKTISVCLLLQRLPRPFRRHYYMWSYLSSGKWRILSSPFYMMKNDMDESWSRSFNQEGAKLEFKLGRTDSKMNSFGLITLSCPHPFL